MPSASAPPRELDAGSIAEGLADRVLASELAHALDRPGGLVFLTGAGISTESGVPTFRGEEGYWRVGSTNYHPQELATRAAFERMPRQVWAWYLYRSRVCKKAEPNVAHRAIAEVQANYSRALLLTQNVDGLHLRAGSPRERTYEIHGNVELRRCLAGCAGVLPLPPEASAVEPSEEISEALLASLSCPRCGGLTRPHVLWFDECYDEPLFRFDSCIDAASEAALLLVVGTTGTTNLPMHVGSLAWQAGATMLVVNPEPNPFSQLALRADRGLFLQGTAGEWLPRIARALGDRRRQVPLRTADSRSPT